MAVQGLIMLKIWICRCNNKDFNKKMSLVRENWRWVNGARYKWVCVGVGVYVGVYVGVNVHWWCSAFSLLSKCPHISCSFGMFFEVFGVQLVVDPTEDWTCLGDITVINLHFRYPRHQQITEKGGLIEHMHLFPICLSSPVLLKSSSKLNLTIYSSSTFENIFGCFLCCLAQQGRIKQFSVLSKQIVVVL